MKQIILILIIAILPGIVRAEISSVKKSDGTTEITMSALDAVKMAGDMVDSGNLDTAEQILTKIPNLGGGPLELERWFLLGRIAAFRGDFDSAISIYRTILDAHPDLARVRFELAVCYMKTEQWYRADYQLRLAMAGDDLPENVRQMMNFYRFVIRQNKNWNVWFNFGAAPDNNVNNAAGGTECVEMFGRWCRDLPVPESAFGYNFQLGGNYEFRLTNSWRWKSDAGMYFNIYNKHNYDDLYLYASTGPRYIWSDGDIWLAGVASRRWYGWDAYNWSAGVRLNTNYDFTRKLSGGLSLLYTSNQYDYYAAYLDGNTYSASVHMFYSITSNIYTVLRGAVAYEDTVRPEYSYFQPSISIGIGTELPYGFNIYAEPMFYWQFYGDEQFTIQNEQPTYMTERDFAQRYSVSVSNNKFDFLGFVPALVLSYTRRDSNIWQREYDRWSVELTLQQRF